MVTTAAEILRKTVREVVSPRDREDIVEWCRQHVRLHADSSAEPGRYDPDRTAYLKRPLRMFVHQDVRRIGCMFASQTAKTTLTDLVKQYAIDQMPGPAMVMFPTIDDAVEYNQERFLPTIRVSPRMRRHLREAPRETKNERIRFDTCVMWFRGSNAPGGRRGKPCRYVFADEIQSYARPRVDKKTQVARHDWTEVFERVKTFADHKIVCISTPGNEGEDIDARFREGSQERYYVPCPRCSAYIRLEQSGLKWEGSTHADLALVKRTAHYQCPECQGKIHDYHKPEMNQRGVWVPEHRTVADVLEHGEGGVSGGIEPENVSFQLSTLYSTFGASTFGDMAVAFVRAKREGGGAGGTKEYVTGWLGEPWVATQDSIEEVELKRLCVPIDEDGYRLGEVPEECLALVLSVDVQKDRLYAVVRGWGERGIGTWLVDWREIPRVEGRNLVELDALPRVYRTKAGREVRVRVEIVDSGHFTVEAYHYVRSRLNKGARCYAAKGSSGSMMAPPYRRSPQDRFPDGKVIPGGLELLWVNTDHWAEAISSRVKGLAVLDVEQDTALESGATPEGKEEERLGFYLPANENGKLDQYLDHMTAEGKKAARRGGQVVHVWEKRAGRENHSWDAERYGFAVADLCGVRRLRRAPRQAPPAVKQQEQRPAAGPFGGSPPWAR
jgi:phage terminase large subunit GpA-like protein